MRISDWSSDVCSSDLLVLLQRQVALGVVAHHEDAQLFIAERIGLLAQFLECLPVFPGGGERLELVRLVSLELLGRQLQVFDHAAGRGSEEHTSELQSLMRISYAVFCLKNKTTLS